uniref:hypothetical protein n=1 Tax=Gordonia paraffinivorans TaxID=175628 RepID=UPI001B355532
PGMMTSSPSAPPGTNDQLSPVRSSRPPDQWFRVWLAFGQGLAGGAVTLLGGYVGYRLAGRTERDKVKLEALRHVNSRLRDLTQFVQSRAGEEPLTLLPEVINEWFTVLEDDPPPKGTPANIIAVEALVGILEIALEEGRAFVAGEMTGRDPAPAIVSVIRRSRAQCSKWITDGSPSPSKLRARHGVAVERRDVAMAEFQTIVTRPRPVGD